MPQASIVADALRTWRKAERAFEATAPGSPDHETARLLVVELRQLYAELTETKAGQQARLRASEAVIRRAHETLERFHSGLMGSEPEPAAD